LQSSRFENPVTSHFLNRFINLREIVWCRLLRYAQRVSCPPLLAFTVFLPAGKRCIAVVLSFRWLLKPSRRPPSGRVVDGRSWNRFHNTWWKVDSWYCPPSDFQRAWHRIAKEDMGAIQRSNAREDAVQTIGRLPRTAKSPRAAPARNALSTFSRRCSVSKSQFVPPRPHDAFRKMK
jgi:hypothetical protein